MIFFIIIAHVLGYKQKNLKGINPTLQDDKIYFIVSQTLNYYSILHQNITAVDIMIDNYIIDNNLIFTENEQNYSIYLSNVKYATYPKYNLTNLTIIDQMVIGYDDQQLFRFDLDGSKLTQLEKKNRYDCNNEEVQMEYYEYLNNYSIGLNDKQLHVITINETCINKKLWMGAQTIDFDALVFNNMEIQFFQNLTFNFSFPSDELLWKQEQTDIKMKYLYSYWDIEIFAIYSNYAICFQYYKKIKQVYGQLICMKIQEEGHKVVDINSHGNKIQILLQDEQNFIFYDQINQCQIYNINQSCNLCYENSYCSFDCHKLQSTACISGSFRARFTLPIFLIFVMFVLMLLSLLLQILRAIGDSWKMILGFFFLIFKFVLWVIPYWIYRKIKFIIRRARKHNRLPVTESTEVCPICLDSLFEPQVFSCGRHKACLDCIEEFQRKTGGNKCPYRD